MDQINVEECDRKKSVEGRIRRLLYVSCLLKDPTKVRLQRILELWDTAPDMRIYELLEALRVISTTS
jgi:hypothetical protein